MSIDKMYAAIEAILFTMGESVETSKIAAAIEQDIPTTVKLIHRLMERYDKLSTDFELAGGYDTAVQVNKICNG